MAEEAGFDVMVTSDQNIRYQQKLSGRKLALVVLGSNIWPAVRQHSAEIMARVDGATPGRDDFIDSRGPCIFGTSADGQVLTIARVF
jgi:hypothetical protein